MENPLNNRNITRREFLKYAEIMGAVALTAPWLAACAQPAAPASTDAAQTDAAAAPAAAVEGLKEVPRNRTFIAVRGGSQG